MKKAFAIMLLIIFVTLSVAVKAFDFESNLEPKAVRRVAPVYPPLAKRKRVEGKAKVGLQIDSEGMVSKTEFIEGNALFKPSSLEAAKQWTFPKTMANTTGYIIFKFELEEKE